MSTNSLIEWTDCTWNPVTGCTKVSPACKNCYAEKTANWLKGMGQAKYRKGFLLTLQPQALTIPLGWKKPRRIFVNSMSDLFHEDIPREFLHEIFAVMNKANQHIFQILTKRSEQLVRLSPELPWTPNVWMGVSVENQDYTFRIDHLRQSNAHVKFLSLEPLLGPLLSLDLAEIDWVIVGGESGIKARPMEVEWVRQIRDQCLAARIPFFFKQWGKIKNNPDPNDTTARGKGKAKGGKLLDGRTWTEMPASDLPQPPPQKPGKHETERRSVVVHCKKSKYDVYIGRPSKWGNPFKIGPDGTRQEVIQKYRRWLLEERPDLVSAAKKELEGSVLGCWCAPKPCHGDVLAEIANSD